jgi:hypothetical protein
MRTKFATGGIRRGERVIADGRQQLAIPNNRPHFAIGRHASPRGGFLHCDAFVDLFLAEFSKSRIDA